MMFITAFILCGALCAILQLIADITKANIQHVLIGSIVAGAVLMPFGVTAALEGFGGAGMIATFMDAGAAFAGTLVTGFTAGTWTPFATILGIVVLQIPCGIWAGRAYAARHPQEFGETPDGAITIESSRE